MLATTKETKGTNAAIWGRCHGSPQLSGQKIKNHCKITTPYDNVQNILSSQGPIEYSVPP
ncbi:hypothetical protein TUM12370_11240 [Salmonella enterica subsp. enterica serovar Choleraesuis]|nr:hypothetical protein TUM12370_11240 [Salmonella enterica subsp. enterica serovar Choleraesuis]